MKIKTLRFKDSKEFVHILEGGQIATSEIPDILAYTASIEKLKLYYESFYPGKEINYNELEVVEFDFIEAGEVGADIRNKLSPLKNLVELLTEYLGTKTKRSKRKTLAKIIQQEMIQTSISVEYLSKLF